MMTSRERWLAACRMETVDRLPFWPKLTASYPRAQAAPFNVMSLAALHEWMGSDPHVNVPDGVREVRRTTSVETHTGERVRRTVYRAPSGTLELVEEFDAHSQAWHPTRFPIRQAGDIAVMIDIYNDCNVELDRAGLEEARAQVKAIGESASTHASLGQAPLMHWVEWLAGVENAHYLLADHPDAVEALFVAMRRVGLRKAEIMAEHHPADMLYLYENTSTTIVSPQQYRRYWMPHMRDYAGVVGARLVLHMCGHLKALLPDLATLPVPAFEALTSAPVGNTSLLDARTACPDKCLIGGTNATLWTRPAHEIIAQIEADLAPLPHHRGLVITSAGVMPPLCSPETIQAVCAWVHSYAARMMES